MFRYELVNSTRKFTIVAEIVSLLKKIYKRDAPFRAVFKVKTLAVLFSAYPREMKHIPRNLNLPPFCRCLFLWKWCNPFPRARARRKHAHSFDRCGDNVTIENFSRERRFYAGSRHHLPLHRMILFFSDVRILPLSIQRWQQWEKMGYPVEPIKFTAAHTTLMKGCPFGETRSFEHPITGYSKY